MGEPLLNADGKPPRGLARGSLVNPFEPQTASLDCENRVSVCKVAFTPLKQGEESTEYSSKGFFP